VGGAILSIGRYAASTLRSRPELEVAAIFERSLYLRHGNAFVCIGDASIGNGPLNARISVFDQYLSTTRIGSVVRSADHCLSFDDGTVLNWGDTPHWTMPPWPQAHSLGSFPLSPLMGKDRGGGGWSAPPRATLEMLIARSPADGLFRPAAFQLVGTRLPTPTVLHVRAQIALAALAEGLVAAPPRRDAHLKTAVRGLIGLGPGLTPSGDDVLAGALLGLHATGNAILAAQLGAHVAAASVDGTSPLSAAFLRCAIDGETSAPLHQALSAAFTNTDWPTTLDTLNHIGHTSGWDHFAGGLLALTAVQLRPFS
jgi:Protein of unknown function (DUF2877)